MGEGQWVWDYFEKNNNSKFITTASHLKLSNALILWLQVLHLPLKIAQIKTFTKRNAQIIGGIFKKGAFQAIILCLFFAWSLLKFPTKDTRTTWIVKWHAVKLNSHVNELIICDKIAIFFRRLAVPLSFYGLWTWTWVNVLSLFKVLNHHKYDIW